MMEILFRGKRLDNGEWVEGDLFHHSDGKTEIFVEKEVLFAGKYLEGIWRVVDPATVGQYTGLTDKNGKKIFDGDVVKYQFNDDYPIYIGVIEFGLHLIKDSFSGFGWFARIIDKNYYGNVPLNESDCFEVIGNIYDTPELLEKKED